MHRYRMTGNALIEVMLAVALMAVTTLGLIAAQLWTTREAHAFAVREQAALFADALAEIARSASAGDAALSRWQTLAATRLPGGDASVRDMGGGASVAQVLWRAQPNLSKRADAIDVPESCAGVAVPAGMHCIVVAFAR